MTDVTDLKIPGRTTAKGRETSITGAFANALLPRVEPSIDEKRSTLRILGINPNNVVCAYCGDPATEWDHLRATVRDKKPTGWGTDVTNLVPSCGKCNQSKGNKDWKEWMLGGAKLSPASRRRPNLKKRIAAIEKFIEAHEPVRFDLKELEHHRDWKEYWSLRNEISQTLEKADHLAVKLRAKLAEQHGRKKSTPASLNRVAIEGED